MRAPLADSAPDHSAVDTSGDCLPEVAALRRVSASIMHGVHLVVEGADGRDIIVPLPEELLGEVAEVLGQARATEHRMLELLSSRSLH